MVIWHILLPKHTTYYIYRYVYYTSIHLYVYTSNDKEKEIEKEKFNEAKTKLVNRPATVSKDVLVDLTLGCCKAFLAF